MMSRSKGSEQRQGPRGLAEIVTERKDAKGWSQAHLAEQAGLSQAALSRLLAKDTPPSFGHLWALAQALEVSVLQLAADAGIEAVLSDFVSREQFEEADRRRVEAVGEASRLRTEIAAQTAEVQHAREAIKRRDGEIQKLGDNLRIARASADEADRLRDDLAQARAKVEALESDTASVRAQLDAVEVERLAAQERVTQLEGFVEAMRARANRLEADMRAALDARDRNAMAAVVSGFVALGAGAWIAATHRGNGRRR